MNMVLHFQGDGLGAGRGGKAQAENGGGKWLEEYVHHVSSF